ncbi:MAG: peptidase M14 [Bdellovibrionaceae bacterium]|nr:peptidase M14 [Pseudobdellovibrionaceae bacterium]|tara:strand:- start:186451 stop:187449 length:999 start_codon:yes stop_codon:yes gene_type:complete
MIWNELPKSFTELEPYELSDFFEPLTLCRVEGEKDEWVFLSVMLHGNEPSGLRVAQEILKKYNGKPPRGLILLIGNVVAAKNGSRRLDDQPDYNRIWLGGEGFEFDRAQDVLNELKKIHFFAGVDIHNNTGKNPPYGCINRLDKKLAQLAKRFSKNCVYFINPMEVLSHRLAAMMTGMTIECGLPNDKEQEKNAFRFVDQLLHLDRLAEVTPRADEINIYHSYTKLLIPDACTVSFTGDTSTDFSFFPHFDELNFQSVKVGESIGLVNNEKAKIIVLDEKGEDRSSEYFTYEEGVIRFKKSCVPSMFTKDVRVIHQDCLGYLMEELSVELLK